MLSINDVITSYSIHYTKLYEANKPFGQVIKTVAQVQSVPSDEITLTAKTNGTVQFLSNNLVVGKTVSGSEKLFSISGNQLAVNNSAVRITSYNVCYTKLLRDPMRLLKTC